MAAFLLGLPTSPPTATRVHKTFKAYDSAFNGLILSLADYVRQRTDAPVDVGYPTFTVPIEEIAPPALRAGLPDSQALS